MAVALDKFLGLLEESGLIPRQELAALVAEIPAARKADGEQLARELVKRKKLTAYQAQEVYGGRGKKLVLGNYVIQDKLGQGGMGMVLKAEHRRMERIVALKVMSKAAVESPEAVKRFHREVKAAAKLTHQNIVTAHDADEANGTHFLVMEFVEGTDLSQLVKKSGPLAVEKAVTCILQAARGLEFAHEHGIVHRDIKPANLLLDAKGNVKILDMGLARIESIGGDQAELTGTGQIMGTVDYMAPEQAMNTKKADHRADIYALGITLWYLLTGKAAYGGETVIEKLMAHQSHPIPSLTELRQDVSPALEAVFQKMVAKTPGERYQSMSEVIAALERSRSCGGDTSPTINLGPSEDAKLSQFLKGGSVGVSPSGDSVGVSPSGGTAAGIGAGTSVLPPPGGPPTSTAAAFEQTIDIAAPQADTDPQTQTSLHAPPAPFAFTALPPATGKPAPQESGLHGPIWTRPLTLVIAGGTAGGLVLLLAIWSLWHSWGGDGVPKISIPPGGSATIQPGPVPLATGWGLDFSDMVGRDTAHVIIPGDFSADQSYTIEMYATPRSDKRESRPLFDGGAICILKTFDQHIVWISEPNVDGEKKILDLMAIDTVLAHRRMHLAAIYTPKELRIFVNGKLMGTRPVVGTLPPKSKAWLGGSSGVAPPEWGPFDGTIDQFRASRSVRYEQDFVPPARLAPDADTLVCYDFHEGEGTTLNDSSGNKRHGTIVGAKWVALPVDPVKAAIAERPPTKSESALRFDGMDDYVELPQIPFMPPGAIVTIEAWATLERPLTLGGMRNVFELGPMGVGAGRIPNAKDLWTTAVFKDGSFVPIPSQKEVAIGKRTHLAVVLDPKGIVEFIDGKEVASRDYKQVGWDSGPFWVESLLKKPILVGAGTGKDRNRAHFWPGTIDEVRISKSRRYTANFTPKPRFEVDADTLGLYHFDEADGDVVKDSSPFHRDGKVIGAKRVDSKQAPPAAPQVVPKAATAPFDATEARALQQQWAKHLGVSIETPNSVGMKMVLIPPGTFTMGRSPADADGFSREKLAGDDLPSHSVTLAAPFAIAATEVTQKQWREVMNTTPWVGKQQIGESDDSPATYVSWKDAREFCKRLSEREQAEYRLPTEVEWEGACRAGTQTSFSFGDSPTLLTEHAWTRGISENRPHPVAAKKANAWGLFDMHGNAWEWCDDVFGAYSAEAVVDPRSSGPGNQRTLRGGCFWSVPTSDYRSSARRSWPETLGYSESGFRPIRTLPSP